MTFAAPARLSLQLAMCVHASAAAGDHPGRAGAARPAYNSSSDSYTAFYCTAVCSLHMYRQRGVPASNISAVAMHCQASPAPAQVRMQHVQCMISLLTGPCRG